jgi:pantoate--beta-alanine ligase
MGFLHDGHLSLVAAARQANRSVIATIFVNPTQFAANEDLSTYPQDLSGDLAKFEANGVDLVWTPTPEVMYPSGYQTWVEVENISRPLEGHERPEHFRGVTTVVTKLFTATRPDRAYFGQKDAQQAAVIRRMTRDLNFPIEIVICPTLREPDGLAMSSRNAYLSAAQRQAAPVLDRALRAAAADFEQGERDAQAVRARMAEIVAEEPLASLQYASCADPDTLHEHEGTFERALLSMAVKFGKTRLIDNVTLGSG